jgi:hypothetical protein
MIPGGSWLTKFSDCAWWKIINMFSLEDESEYFGAAEPLKKRASMLMVRAIIFEQKATNTNHTRM